MLARYERILQADPSSPVFVELARAFLARGDAERAATVCAHGIEHHPESVVARVIWGEALLALGRPDDAIARLEEAVETCPSDPRSYDLAGETLVRSQLHEHARRILARGAARHPGDARIRLWLERAGESVPPAGAPLTVVVPSTPARSPSADPPPGPAASSPPSLPRITTRANGGNDKDGESAGGGVLALIPDVAPDDQLPGTSSDGARQAPDGEPSWPDPTDLARAYEQDLRQRIATEARAERPASRGRRAAIAVGLLAVATVAGTSAYLPLRTRHRAASLREAVDAASKGLARDTLGSLRAAAGMLAEARRDAPDDRATAELAAQVSGLLWHDFEDSAARGSSRELVDSGRAGGAESVVRWLVGDDGPERDAAAATLVGPAPAPTPLADAIGGEILLARRDPETARLRLARAAEANPPLLRAISRLGDLELAGGDAAAALDRQRVVLRVQPTHARAVLGAAEASLALGVDLDGALRALEAMEADPGSAPPMSELIRTDLVAARLLATAGRGLDAERRLESAARRGAGEGALARARADVLAREGDIKGAADAAARARQLAPEDAEVREIFAALQLRLGRYRELTRSDGPTPTRKLRTYRGIARLALGEAAAARRELEATRHDGKMTPEAAAWLALAEIASDRRPQATAIVRALLASPPPHPVALVARARLYRDTGRADLAERRLREAVDRDPDLLLARCDLGGLLLERGRVEEAREVLEKAVARAPWLAMPRVLLARARLASGDRDAALRELNAVVVEAPEDPTALAEARRALRSIPRP